MPRLTVSHEKSCSVIWHAKTVIRSPIISEATFTNISAEETGRASSIFNTHRQVASSFGVALVGTVLFESLQTHPQTAPDQLFDFHTAFAVAGILGLVSILFAMTIRNQDVAASLGARSKNRGVIEKSRDYGS